MVSDDAACLNSNSMPTSRRNLAQWYGWNVWRSSNGTWPKMHGQSPTSNRSVGSETMSWILPPVLYTWRADILSNTLCTSFHLPSFRLMPFLEDLWWCDELWDVAVRVGRFRARSRVGLGLGAPSKPWPKLISSNPAKARNRVMTGSLHIDGLYSSSGMSGCSTIPHPWEKYKRSIISNEKCKRSLPIRIWSNSLKLSASNPQSMSPLRMGLGPFGELVLAKRACDHVSHGGPARKAWMSPRSAASLQKRCVEGFVASPHTGSVIRSSDTTWSIVPSCASWCNCSKKNCTSPGLRRPLNACKTIRCLPIIRGANCFVSDCTERNWSSSTSTVSGVGSNWNSSATNSFLSDEARRIWKPKTWGTKLPDRSFFSKIVAFQRF